MLIGTREISPDHPPYIIAELGVNHDGSPARALELVQLAADAGADAIKLQLFEADRLMSKAAKLAAYQKAAGERDPIDMLRRLELSIDDMKPCVDLAHKLGIHAIVSVFSVELVPIAERLPWDAYKTASPDIINKPLLDALAATGKPLIVSTGASTEHEIRRCVEWLESAAPRLALLQCVSSYPTAIEDGSFDAIRWLYDAFPHLTIGYSDHTAHQATSSVAVLHGATILEKHFTYDRSATGPDHAASLHPTMFATYVEHARDEFARRPSDPAHVFTRKTRLLTRGEILERMTELDAPESLRNPQWRKRVLPIEQDVRTVSRQSLTTTRPIPAGHTLTRADLTIKRPGTGIPPYELDTTIGRALARAVEADMPLMPNDLRSS